MFTFLPISFKKFFSHLSECATRRREARYAERKARRRQARYAHPRLEGLEERIVPDAYSFEVNGNPSNGNYTNGQLWTDTNTKLTGNVPGAGDTADIPTGVVCTVDAAEPVGDLSVEGTLNVNNNLTVAANNALGLTGTTTIAAGGIVTVADEPSEATLQSNVLSIAGTLTDNAKVNVVTNSNPGSGTTTVVAGGIFNLGSTDDINGDAELQTNSFSDSGTTYVGSPTGGGTASLDAVMASLTGGLLDLGLPTTGGGAGDMDVTTTMTVSGTSGLDVGSSNGSGGSLDVNSLTSTTSTLPNIVVNSSGEISVQNTATLGGSTTVAGGEIKAEQGANVVFAGPGYIGGTGKLSAEINAFFTFAPSSSWVIGPGDPPGSALNDGKFYVYGPLAVDTTLVPSSADIILDANGSNLAGSIGGTGSIEWYNGEFDWNGGTIGGLTGGGFTLENGDFKVQGSDPKFLATTMTVTGSGPADFGGTGTLTITGPGVPAGTGALINDATSILPLDLSLPLINGLAGDGSTPGALTNNGTLAISGTSPMTISAPLVNTVSGVIDCDTGAGPLTLSDLSGTSVLDGKIGLNNDSLTIIGLYTTTSGAFEEEFSADDTTTLTGTLAIDSGASADFDHLILTEAPGSGTGGLITGAGDFSIDADGGGSNDYLTWMNGAMTGSGLTTIGPNATLTLSGVGMMARNLDNHGTVVWAPSGAGIGYGSGVTLHNETDGTFDFESSTILPEVDNDGMLEVAAGDTPTIGTFTQSSTGTLQSDIDSASSFGSLRVTGVATLDGTLQAELEDGYQPPSGTAFGVLSFASSSGQFADVEPQGWSATYNPTNVQLVSP